MKDIETINSEPAAPVISKPRSQMGEFTPGPWHASSTHLGKARDIGAVNGANIALVSGPPENGADEFEANARLIAAAPELLAELIALLNWAQAFGAFRDDVGQGVESHVRELIAKATGGLPR